MYTKVSIFLGSILPVLSVPVAHAKPYSIETYIAAASSQNSAKIEGSFSNAGGINIPGEWHYIASATTRMSFNNSSGIIQESQNAGANSTLQNAISVAYISTCAMCLKTGALGLSVTIGKASNTASVNNNLDFPGYGWANPSAGGGNNGGNTPGGNGLTPQGSDPFATVTGSFNHDDGILSDNQNGGNNSSVQSSIAVGAVSIDVGKFSTLAGSITNNSGVSQKNISYSYDTPTSSNVESSFNGSVGALILNQNSGSNSLVQNSATITYSNLKSAPSSLLESTAAQSKNTASLANNFSSPQNQQNLSLASNSFNNSVGVLISSQNAGANSIVQNATAVSDVSGK